MRIRLGVSEFGMQKVWRLNSVKRLLEELKFALLPARQLRCEQVLFLAASVCPSVRVCVCVCVCASVRTKSRELLTIN